MTPDLLLDAAEAIRWDMRNSHPAPTGPHDEFWSALADMFEAEAQHHIHVGGGHDGAALSIWDLPGVATSPVARMAVAYLGGDA